MYHSEYEQDKWLDGNIFRGLKYGIFVDIGAYDGVFHSNTCFFEQERGWQGICVEPNPIVYQDLSRNRPGAQNINCAISSKTDGVVKFYQIEGALKGWSGIVDFIEPEHWARIKERDLVANIVEVSSCSLESVFELYKLKGCHYLSIDVEGAEQGIVSTFPFDRYNIAILEVEVNFDNEIDEIVRSKGFQFLVRLGVSNIYRGTL